MNAWENVPHDPLADEEQLDSLWDQYGRFHEYQKVRLADIAPPSSWWYRWWPKLAALALAMGLWALFFWEASR